MNLQDKFKEYLDFAEKHKNKIKIAVVMIIMIAAVLIFGGKGEDDTIPVQLTEEVAEANAEDEDKEDTAGKIYVDISGQVKSPGVYQVESGSRLFQVIELAGGLTEDADLDSFNQAQEVADGEKIIILAKGEAGATSQGSNGKDASGKININTADNGTLQEIPGVGPATAEKIIAYRTENGSFASPEDIKNVSGIGDKTFQKMKDMITT